MTTTTPKVHQAWADVMAAIPGVPKKDRNRDQGYDFRGIDAVVSAVGPVLREHRIIVIPTLLNVELSEVQIGKNRTPMGRAKVEVRWTVTGPGGDSFDGVTAGEGMDVGDKALTKAQTVAWRVFLIQALALPTDDRDPDHDSYQRARGEVQRDWVAQAKASTDAEEVRAIWRTARAGGASIGDLEEITKLGAQLAPPADEEAKTEEPADPTDKDV